MRSQCLLTTCLLASAACFVAPAARAQSAHLFHEFSVNGGASWSAGPLLFEQSPSAPVRVRVSLSFNQQSMNDFVTFLQFDQFVVRPPSATDSIADVRVFNPSFTELIPAPFLSVHELGPILKIDAMNDTEAPGAGSGGVRIVQTLGFEASAANPLRLLQYDLSLDAAPGVRDLSAIALQGTDGTSVQVRRAATNTYEWLPLQIHDNSITIVPTPGTIGVTAAIGCWAGRRRRTR